MKKKPLDFTIGHFGRGRTSFRHLVVGGYGYYLLVEDSGKRVRAPNGYELVLSQDWPNGSRSLLLRRPMPVT